MKLKIDEEFKSLIPPLTPEEYKQLEDNIIKEGVRDAIVTWNGMIIDGHNRYNICKEHNIKFKTVEQKFDTPSNEYDRYEVINWIINNQLGRRNLIPAQKQYLMHKMVDNEENRGGDRRSKDFKTTTNVVLENSQKEVAKKLKIHENTVYNAHKFGKAVDKLDTSGLDKNDILSGKTETSQKDVIKLASFKRKKRGKIIKKLQELDVDVKTAIKQVERDYIRERAKNIKISGSLSAYDCSSNNPEDWIMERKEGKFKLNKNGLKYQKTLDKLHYYEKKKQERMLNKIIDWKVKRCKKYKYNKGEHFCMTPIGLMKDCCLYKLEDLIPCPFDRLQFQDTIPDREHELRHIHSEHRDELKKLSKSDEYESNLITLIEGNWTKIS